MLARLLAVSLLLLAVPAPAEASPFGNCGEYPGPTTSVDVLCERQGHFCVAYAANRCFLPIVLA